MSIFRADNGNYYLKGLFFEETSSDKSSVIYTLKDSDHLGYPSLYRLYMEANDPTEYRFATQHLEGWEHWDKLSQCTWFQPFVTRWRKELQLRLASNALARIIAESKATSRDSFTANRYLLERGWMPKDSSKGGRPTKEAIRAEAHSIASNARQITADFDRLISVN